MDRERLNGLAMLNINIKTEITLKMFNSLLPEHILENIRVLYKLFLNFCMFLKLIIGPREYEQLVFNRKANVEI
jgi:hypothetical protein